MACDERECESTCGAGIETTAESDWAHFDINFDIMGADSGAFMIEVDPDREDLERMLLEYWSQPNTKQLNIRIPATAKRMIERLAKRKTIEASTLVRMWVIECMRREAMQP